MAESDSVEAVLSARDRNFTSTLKSATKSLFGLQGANAKTSLSVGKLAKGFALGSNIILIVII